MTKAYSLKARIKGADGVFSPFELSVSRTLQADTGEYGCVVDCPFLLFDNKKIFGATAEQAMALALWLIDDQLRHRGCELVADDGSPITLPISLDAGVPVRKA